MSADAMLRTVAAVHGRREIAPNPPALDALAEWLRGHYGSDGLLELYGRYAHGDDAFTALMRSAIWGAGAKRVGPGLAVGSGAGFKHLETFTIGAGVFIGAQSYLQGRFDGVCTIGDHVWIGPQAYFDARHLIVEDYVGWGPGARVLGSTHTGLPLDVPVIQTDLEIRPVRICEGADIGTGAVILPGITVGRGSIVGAGAVVTEDVPPYSVAAGIPARVVRARSEPRRRSEGRSTWNR